MQEMLPLKVETCWLNLIYVAFGGKITESISNHLRERRLSYREPVPVWAVSQSVASETVAGLGGYARM